MRPESGSMTMAWAESAENSSTLDLRMASILDWTERSMESSIWVPSSALSTIFSPMAISLPAVSFSVKILPSTPCNLESNCSSNP